jgi:sugar phosphate isomerase/epimerase
MNQLQINYPLSVLLTSLPLDFTAAVQLVAELGFQHVDVVALAERPPDHLEALAAADVMVCCASLGRGLPDELALDAPGLETRRAAVAVVKQQIADVSRLGAASGYLVPGQDASPAALGRFADSCRVLADYAQQRQVRLCIEHCPGRALPTVAATLAWLAKVRHETLHLLLDLGHCLISKEEPAEAIRQAGTYLGYVHCDDNDGHNDCHWPLLTGRLSVEQLSAAVKALKPLGYRGALCLELNPQNPDPVEALRQGKLLLEQHVSGSQEARRP